jgi:hypothetical protein
MLSDFTVPVPESVRSQLLRGISGNAVGRQRASRGMIYVKIGVVLAVALLVLAARFFRGLEGGPLVAVGVAGGVFALLFLLWNHKKDHGIDDRRERDVRENLDRNVMLQRSLVFGNEQAWIEHEHGVMVFAGIDQARTLFLDLSSIVDDPRYELYENKSLFRREWSSLQFPGGDEAVYALFVRGEPFSPRFLCEGPDTMAAFALCEFLGSPGNGQIVNKSWKDIVEFARLKGLKGAS